MHEASGPVTITEDELHRCIRRVLGGDTEAFEVIIFHHQRLVWKVVNRYLFNNDLAEDVVQQSLFQVYRHLERYDPTQPFAAWVVGIARNQSRMALRSHAIKLQQLTAYREFVEQEADSVTEHVMVDALRQCQSRLKGINAEIIRLKYVEGLQFKEIAEKIDRSVQATTRMASRIRAVLRDCIEQRVGLL